MSIVNVGIVGFGTVGAGVVKILMESAQELAAKTGREIRLKWICDVDLERERAVRPPKEILTSNLNHVLDDPEVAVVVELIGGIDAAKMVILEALNRRKHVVTANKALLAAHGRELFERAWDADRCIMFEASVGGGIPIIAAIREGFIANRINAIFGIVNGTCNYILTRMFRENANYEDVLREAQAQGYAEKDPTLDVGGGDSAHKLAILAALGFAADFDFKDILVEGITGLELVDIQYARELGYVIKLLAIGKRTERGLELRVHPTLLPQDHPLAQVGDVFNAIFVQGDAVGDAMLYGRGAGMMPTASAVVSDIVSIALGNGPRAFAALRLFPGRTKRVKVLGRDEIESSYYLRLKVKDQPGVMATIAGVLAAYNISIESLVQRGRSQNEHEAVPLLVITHRARESSVQEAVREIDRQPVVLAPTRLVRVEE